MRELSRETEANAAGSEAFLSDYKVAERYDISRITVWRWSGQGRFPKPVRLSENCTRWRLSDVLDWESKQL